MEIPVRTVGNARGVRNGGVLRMVTRKLRVKAIPANLPDIIEVDITNMRIGNKMYITAISSDDYKILHPENTVICQVRTSRTAIADLEDEEEEEELEEGAEEGAEAPAEAAAEE
jgi:large subunit ribosomal protein L25